MLHTCSEHRKAIYSTHAFTSCFFLGGGEGGGGVQISVGL